MDRILLLAAALLWGGTLSAQRISTQFLGAFSFMGCPLSCGLFIHAAHCLLGTAVS